MRRSAAHDQESLVGELRRMRQLTAEALGEELANRFLDPDACQRAAALLRNQPRPDPVGCCEIAFARAAVLKFVVRDTQLPSIAARVNGGIDLIVARRFDGAHTARTAVWYGAADLRSAAATGVEHYLASAFWSDRVAKALADRLGLARPPPEVAWDFAAVVEQAVVWITKVTIR